ncbi:MAG: hypothetical protein H5U36_09925 [Candidatus Caldatribacterium sp.]|nr:hypothetical protein [Candidatus Caldatribacterium sp.]
MVPGTPNAGGGGANPSPEEYILKILEKLEKDFEKLEERLRCVEKELASLKVWYGVISFIVPSILLAVLLRGLKLQ